MDLEKHISLLYVSFLSESCNNFLPLFSLLVLNYIFNQHFLLHFQCSVTCGKGTRFRTSECRNSKNVKQPDSHCDSSSLIVSQVCEERPCPEWGVGEWTEVKFLVIL